MAKAITLGPVRGLYQPDYELHFYRDGDPRRPLNAKLNLGSIVSISTSKSIGDLAGTWSIVLKDGRARHVLREMDTVRIRLRGHRDGRLVTVLKGVVDEVRAAGSADPGSSSEDTVITGRCSAKYLQITSLFLPVWDPEALLPTALTFGLGDAAKKVGGNRPYDIFRYLVRKYTYGEKGLAGVSGIPNSRYWLDHRTRFARSSVDFQVPFLQLDEDSVGDALKRMEVLGFTEAWVDELGRIVYRHPGWDSPVAYRLSTNDLVDWNLNRTDVDAATYVEVIPAGDPSIDSATAQALRAGRAPVPSSYLSAQQDSGLAQTVSPEFVIETDSKGHVTTNGARNRWYKLQRRLGLRPQQITSPLLASQEQAQAQAEGLLRFLTRMQKGGTLVIPGAPEVRLGYTLLLHGELDGVRINRTFYIEGVQHSLVWGDRFTTTLTVSHGRDPWDAKWSAVVLPKADPAALASDGGVLDPGPASDAAPPPGEDGAEPNGQGGTGPATDARGINASAEASKHLQRWTNPDGSVKWVAKWMIPQLVHAKKTGKWSGVITEGWRSYETEQVYWDRYGHDPGLAARPGTSNHGYSMRPGGAIDTSDPGGLQAALRGWTGSPGALRGNGIALPRDTVHFSADGT